LEKKSDKNIFIISLVSIILLLFLIINKIFISNPLLKEMNNLKNEDKIMKDKIEEKNIEINNWNKLVNVKNEEQNKEINNLKKQRNK
jgi:predicted PurR-regulated permease PerM